MIFCHLSVASWAVERPVRLRRAGGPPYKISLMLYNDVVGGKQSIFTYHRK